MGWVGARWALVGLRNGSLSEVDYGDGIVYTEMIPYMTVLDMDS